MAATIRPYRTDDRDAVVALALRAWAPVFASLRAVTGDEIDGLLHGDDWRAYQGRSVEHALDNDVAVLVQRGDDRFHLERGRADHQPHSRAERDEVRPPHAL